MHAQSLPDLLPHHLAELRASGLSDETITAAGIRSETNYDRVKVILNWKRSPKRLLPAIVFPFADGYSRVKFDRPRIIGGKSVKYESPKGRANEIYLPPGVADRLSDPTARLFLTEGEKKALASTQAGFACIGLTGVYGWKDGKHESLLPVLERIVWQGRQVFIVFDSDIAEKPDVQEAEARLAQHLVNRGAVVKAVRLPPDETGGKQGLDDYLVACGPAAFQQLIDEAIEPGDMAPVELKQLASFLDAAIEAKKIVESELFDGLSRLRFWRGNFYQHRHGKYLEIPNAEARAAVIQALNRKFLQLSAHKISDVVDQLKAQTILANRTEPPAWLASQSGDAPTDEVLPTRNGLIDLQSLVTGADYFTPATPRFFTTTAVDLDFDIAAPKPELWLSTLGQLWPSDQQSIDTLQEWAGYLLMPDTSQQKILMLIGPPRCGKGTIARVLRQLLGPDNVAGPTLSSLGTNFGLWPLLNKSAAFISDARLSGRTDQAVTTERLLSISGEDALTIDRKNLEPVTTKLSARLVILSNELPRLGDSSGALTGRMIILRLTESFYNREDPKLTEKLVRELPGILLWAIEGWRRLRERGCFLQPDSGNELKEELYNIASPVGAFLKDRCVIQPGSQTPIDALFNAWRQWCELQGRDHPGTIQVFGRDLLAAAPSVRVVQPRVADGKRYRAYDGIRLL